MSFLAFAQNEVFITVEPFRDWTPRLQFESQTPYGKLKFEYKLFGQKKLKYKLFNLFDINLSRETLKNPERIKGVREYRKTVELLIKNKKDLKGGREKVKPNNSIFCRNFRRDTFCSYTEKGENIVFPIGLFLSDFTIFVEYGFKPKRCEIFSVKTFEDVELSSLQSIGFNLKFTFGGLRKFLKTSGRDYLIISKRGRRVYVETSKDKKFLISELQKVYISKLVVRRDCQKLYRFYFYPRALTPEEVQILKDNLLKH